jgi:hypothetical protein
VLLQLVADRLAENEIKSQKDNLKNRGAIKNAVKENNSEVRDERKNAANWAFAAKIVSGVTTIGMSAASMAPLKGGGDVGLEHSRMMGRTGDAVSGAEMGVGDFVSSTQNAEANLKEANGQVETSEIGISQDRANRSQDNASKAAAIKEEMQRQKVNIDRGIAEMMR